jgi:hypothetical protein
MVSTRVPSVSFIPNNNNNNNNNSRHLPVAPTPSTTTAAAIIVTSNDTVPVEATTPSAVATTTHGNNGGDDDANTKGEDTFRAAIVTPQPQPLLVAVAAAAAATTTTPGVAGAVQIEIKENKDDEEAKRIDQWLENYQEELKKEEDKIVNHAFRLVSCMIIPLSSYPLLMLSSIHLSFIFMK